MRFLSQWGKTWLRKSSGPPDHSLNSCSDILVKTCKSRFLTFELLFARLGTNAGRGEFLLAKLNYSLFQLSKVPSQSLFPGWTWRERTKIFSQGWHRLGEAGTLSVLLQPTLDLLVFFFFLFIVNNEGKDERKSYLRRQLLHLSVQVHQRSIKVTWLTNSCRLTTLYPPSAATSLPTLLSPTFYSWEVNALSSAHTYIHFNSQGWCHEHPEEYMWNGEGSPWSWPSGCYERLRGQPNVSASGFVGRGPLPAPLWAHHSCLITTFVPP